MGHWQDGYVTDIPYTAGFYRELSPAYLHLMALLMGVRPPIESGRPYAYAELGCGQGLGTMLLAAANPLGTFVGFDFNPAQIARADDLARRAGLGNVAFREESFESLASKGEDPERFDLVVLHGIYSWVSEQNRRFIIRFIGDRLKPGGMVYVSYNCMPGWAAFAPAQRLMLEYVERRRDRSDEGVLAAMEFARKLAAGGARYFAENDAVTRQLEQLRSKNPVYLAHEYLNAHWAALYHADVVEAFEDARMAYVGSATISDNVAALSTPEGVRELLKGTDPVMAETVRDFATNRRFRRDLFVRGPVRLNPTQFEQAFADIAFTLTVEAGRTASTLQTAAGEVRPKGPAVDAILERLKNEGTTTFAEFASLAELSGLPAWRLAQTLALLVESGQVHPAPHLGDVLEDALQASRRLNEVLLEMAQSDDSCEFLAAPLIGSASYVAHPEQLLLLAMKRHGLEDSGPGLSFVWKALRRLNKRVLVNGQPVEGEQQAVEELARRAERFAGDRLDLLRRVGSATV